MNLVTIPHGIAINDSWVQKVGLREINGYDEQLLAEIRDYPIPFKTSVLLGRVIELVDDSNNSSAVEIARQLTAGDRIALILHNRKMTFGNDLRFHIKCKECTETMSVDLLITDLLQPSLPHPKSEYFIDVEDMKLKIRPITGADLESLFTGNSSNRAEKLALSCLLSSDPAIPKTPSEVVFVTICTNLEEIDPQANLILGLTCPTCSDSFSISFNVEDFFFREINDYSKRSEQEIHWLAFNYHWDEHSILSLPLKKRKRYVDLINRTLRGENI